jgi:hypothetical protein
MQTLYPWLPCNKVPPESKHSDSIRQVGKITWHDKFVANESVECEMG